MSCGGGRLCYNQTSGKGHKDEWIIGFRNGRDSSEKENSTGVYVVSVYVLSANAVSSKHC